MADVLWLYLPQSGAVYGYSEEAASGGD